MPIYEYQCASCGHELEALQRLSDPLLSDCPECGESALKKKVSAAGFRLKGTGWYATDFKNKDEPKAKGDKPADKDQKKDSGDKSEGKAEGAKTETKTESKTTKTKSDSGD
jgi:putative FmdB family regulatory protein